ncbi:MAG TPA: hypothetical protein VGM64_19440 [Lacunisphaera sp.]|jgi:hypothetical protein
MKTPAQYISLVTAASSAAVAFFAIANSTITTRFPFGIVFSIAASIAVIGIAAYDYSRRAKSLRSPARLLRPAMPVANASTNVPARLNKSVRAERIAA